MFVHPELVEGSLSNSVLILTKNTSLLRNEKVEHLARGLAPGMFNYSFGIFKSLSFSL